MIIYTDKFLKPWMGGRQLWFVALIRPENRNKSHIVEHEKEHIKQWWKTTILSVVPISFLAYVLVTYLNIPKEQLYGLAVLPPSFHGILYSLVRKYRLWAEIEAHQVTLSYVPDKINYYAKQLANNYKLDLSEQEIKILLRG